MAYDAVVFDMDGVIFDSEREVLRCWVELADKYGVSHVEETVYACIGTNKQRTREIVLETYGKDFPYEAYNADASALFHKRFDGGRLPMKPGVRSLLDWLQKENKKIALASSTRSEVVRRELREADLLTYFDAVIGGDMVSRSKPEPDIFLEACRAVGAEPVRCFAIEDSYNGIRAAYAGGLRPIMVPDLLPANDEMRSLAETIEDNLEEVRRFLAEQY